MEAQTKGRGAQVETGRGCYGEGLWRSSLFKNGNRNAINTSPMSKGSIQSKKVSHPESTKPKATAEGLTGLLLRLSVLSFILTPLESSESRKDKPRKKKSKERGDGKKKHRHRTHHRSSTDETIPSRKGSSTTDKKDKKSRKKKR